MTTIEEIYAGAERLIHEVIRRENSAQGHYLTGALEDSLESKISKKGKADVMQGLAVYYTQFVNDGFPAESASMAQYPFLLEYFIKRGFPVFSSSGNVTAGQMAAMTINKWMKEGMPTQASKRFSSTGSRTNMIENAITGAESEIDEYMTGAFDFAIEEKFQKTKSETI